jgi:hypothetical protein
LIKNHTGSNNKFLKRKVVLGKILKREKTWREKKFTTLKDEISNKTREF